MWLYLPTSACSAVSAVLTSPSKSLHQRLSASVMWRAIYKPPTFWQRVCKTDRWTKRQSGLTLEPSTANRLAAKWTESLAASPVRICPSRENEQESTVPKVASGLSTSASFAKFSPAGVLSRTSPQFSLFPQEELYSENLPNWGSMRNGELYAQPKWEPATEESGHSCWPTARASDTNGAGPHGDGGLDLRTVAAQWTTPQAHDVAPGNPNRIGRYGTKHGGRNLTDDVMAWPTPSVPNGGRTMNSADIAAKGATAKGKRQVGLENVVSIWPTPDCNTSTYSNGHNGFMNLREATANWPTPAATDYNIGEAIDETFGKNSRPLNEEACRFSLPAPAMSDGPAISTAFPNSHRHSVVSTGDFLLLDALVYCRLAFHARMRNWAGSSPRPSLRKKLNVTFGEWLMNWPLGWTSSAELTSYGASAMESWLSRERQCLRSLAGEPDCGSESEAA